MNMEAAVPYIVEGEAEGVEVSGASAAEVSAALDLLEAARHVQADLSQLRREDLVKVMMMVGIDPLPAVAVKQARRVADLRARLVAREGAYTYASMVQTFGYPNEDAARSSVSKLRKDGLVTVTYDGRTLVPAFQLGADGRHARPEVAEVAAALGEIDPWEAWAWWCTASSLLSGESPVAVLASSPGQRGGRVVRAASRFAARRRNATAGAGTGAT